MITDNGTFPLFDSTWTASEEQILIDSVEQYGLGNWDEVSENITTKTAKEVEDHYMQVYVDGYFGRFTVPGDIPNRMTDHTPPIHESISSVQLPTVNVSKQEQLELAYMPNRDDFEYEYDNDAECVISSLFMNHEDNDLEKALKLTKVDMYHTKLKERQRRKDIAREYKVVEHFFKKHDVSDHNKYERELRSSFKCCSQFMKLDQFEKMIEDMVKERRLKRRISKLKNYRKNGMTKFEACNAFDAGCYKREKKKKERGNVENKFLKDADSSSSDMRQQAEYSLLAGKEKQLCHSMKLPPSKYMTSKLLIIKDAIMKQHTGQNKLRYSLVVEKPYRRRISNCLQENGWIS
ncbi:transcriptional adapter 2-beta-like isoform X2 [Clavelina lepadiformis]